MAVTLEELIIKLEVQGAKQAASELKDVGRAAEQMANKVQQTNVRTQTPPASRGGGGAMAGFPRMPYVPTFQMPSMPAMATASGSAGGASMVADMGLAGVGGAMAAAGVAGIIAAGVSVIKGILDTLANALRNAVDRFTSFVRTVMEIEDLTGGTPQQAARLAIGFQAAGINSGMGVREIMHMEQSTRSGRGAAAISQLGIKPGGDGAEMFMKIVAALSQMQDGVKKTQMIMDIFGQRGAAALGPLLHMTAAQAAQVSLLASHFNGAAVDAVQQFTTGLNILGQTIQIRLVDPFLTKVLPVLTMVIDKVTQLVNYVADIGGQIAAPFIALWNAMQPIRDLVSQIGGWFEDILGKINQLTNGLIPLIAATTLLGVAIAGIAIAMAAAAPVVIGALAAIMAQILATAAAQAVLSSPA